MTATVSKKSVDLVMPKLYEITFNLTVLDGGTEVINKDFRCEYHTGDNPASKVLKVTEEMQKEIDNYKAEQGIFNATALNTAVTNIQNGLTL